MSPKPERRGRSRFSKVLPILPPPPITKDKSPALPSIPTSSRSMPPPPAPPIPKVKMSIARRPVGGALGGAQSQSGHSRRVSGASACSVYSDAPALSRILYSSSNKTKDSPSAIDSELGPIPPLLSKDNRRQKLPKIPNILASPASSFHPSPSPEILRSQSVQSDRIIVLPELELDRSDAFMTSYPRQPPPQRPLPAVPAQLPPSLEGRKPIPPHPVPPQPDFMGTKISKLKDNLGKTKRASDDYSNNGQAYPSSRRLPTPEYLKTDNTHPMTPQVLSPVSPETPPNDLPPVIPPRFESLSEFVAPVEPALANTPNRPNVLSSHSRDTSETLADTTNRPNLVASHSRESSDTLTITSEPAIMRSQPQPKTAYPSKILPNQTSPPPDKTSPLPSPAANLASKFPKFPFPAVEGTFFPRARARDRAFRVLPIAQVYAEFEQHVMSDGVHGLPEGADSVQGGGARGVA